MMKKWMKRAGAATGLIVVLGLSGCGPNTVDGCLNKAAEYAVNQKWPAALKFAGRAVALDPRNIPALLFQAIAYERCGERDMALNSAGQAVALDPDNFAAQYTLGRLYLADPARATDAMTALLRANRLRPGDPDTLILLANAAASLRSPQLAGYLEELKRLNPAVADTPAYLTQLGISQIGRGEYEAAKRSFMAACRKSKNTPDTVFNMGTFMDRYAGSKSNARAFYNLFLKQTSGRPEYAAQRQEAEARLARLAAGR